MKNFILIMVCMSASALNAQTTLVKKHSNGMLDTVWHIQKLDTFLIEHYRPNGHLKSQIWRNDSAYFYDNHKNIVKKEYYFKKKLKEIPFCPDTELEELASKCYKKQIFFPNGNIAQHTEWSSDTLLQYRDYDVHGKVLQQNVFHKTQLSIFEWVVQSENLKIISIFDTLHSLGKRWIYDGKGQLRNFFQHHIESFYYKYEANSLTQYVQYDSLGKKYYEWHLDSNQIIPFKDNGLCLYGFVNLKGDTIVPARYEGVETVGQRFNPYNIEPDPYTQFHSARENLVGQAFNPHYIVHTATQYGVLDAFGNAPIPPNWTFLERFKWHDRNDSMLEQTYLRCRTKTGFGIMRLNGQMILQPVYQDIRKYKNDLFEVKIGGSWGIVDAHGQMIVQPIYPHLDFTNRPNLYLVEESVRTESEESERYGLIRADGRVLLNTAFKAIKPIGAHAFYVEAFQEESGIEKKGIFHPEKGWIFDTLYHIDWNEKSYFYLKNLQNEQTALIDIPTMQPFLPLQYDMERVAVLEHWDATQLDGVQHDTLMITKKDNKFGLFDPRTRKWVLPVAYDFLTELEMDSLFATLKNGVWAIRNAKGQIIDNHIYTHIGIRSHGFFGQRGDSVLFFNQRSFPAPASMKDVVEDDRKLDLLHTFDDKTLLVNSLQKVVVPIAFQIASVEGDFAVVRDTIRHIQYLTDHQGKKMVLLPQFKVLQMNMDENVMIVLDSTTEQLGAIRKNGNFILPSKYFSIYPLDSAGVIWAKKEASPPLSGNQWLRDYTEKLDYERDTIHDSDKGWQMYDKTGRLLTNTLFEYAFEWHDSVGIGHVNGKFGLWHASGKNLVLPNYDKIWYDDFNQIYHLFELQTNDNQLVGFASSKGEMMADGLFKKMSVFNGQYAFVETAQGLGIVSKTGQFLVEPKPYSIQQSVLKLMSLMDSSWKEQSNRSSLYGFQSPFEDSWLSPFKISFNQLSVENQLLIHNLLIEHVAPNYFLQPNRITYERSRLRLYDPYNLSAAEFAPQHRPHHLHNALITKMLHIEAIEMTSKYINFSMYENDFSSHGCLQQAKIQKSLNFKRVNDHWEKVRFDNLLIINDKNNALFLKLVAQKLSALKNTDLDCSDPSKYIEMIKENFYVLEEGIQFRLVSRNDFYETTHVVISFSWAELKPFLN